MYLAVKFIHVLAIFGSISTSFYALSAPLPERRKWIAMVSGTFGLLALLTGLHLIGVSKIGLPLWLIVKIFCWLGVVGLVPISFKNPEKKMTFTVVVALLYATALTMVYLRPF